MNKLLVAVFKNEELKADHAERTKKLSRRKNDQEAFTSKEVGHLV